MNWLRYFMLSLLALVIVALALATHYYYKGFYKTRPANFKSINNLDEKEVSKIGGKAIELKKFALDKSFNKKIIFLVDMSLPFGKE